MLSTCNNIRDITVISTLYDSGYRVSEMLTIKVKDIGFDEFGMRLTVRGKLKLGKSRQLRPVFDYGGIFRCV